MGVIWVWSMVQVQGMMWCGVVRVQGVVWSFGCGPSLGVGWGGVQVWVWVWGGCGPGLGPGCGLAQVWVQGVAWVPGCLLCSERRMQRLPAWVLTSYT